MEARVILLPRRGKVAEFCCLVIGGGPGGGGAALFFLLLVRILIEVWVANGELVEVGDLILDVLDRLVRAETDELDTGEAGELVTGMLLF